MYPTLLELIEILSFILISVESPTLFSLENVIFVYLDNETWLSVGSEVAMT